MLKADLHTHTKGDPQDIGIRYTPKDLIDLAAKQRYDVLGITWHNKICHTKPLQSYAQKKGILLLEGIEATISGKHTLLYNITNKEMSKVQTHDDLYELKDHVIIGAPHPFFFLPVCLREKVFEHKKLFDFIEHSHYYTEKINFNTKAIAAARQLNVPVVANSDVHFLSLFGKDYSFIDAPQNKDAILDVLKKKATGRNKKRIAYYTEPYSFSTFIRNGLYFAPGGMYRFMTGDLQFQKG